MCRLGATGFAAVGALRRLRSCPLPGGVRAPLTRRRWLSAGYSGACLKPDSVDYDCKSGNGDGPDFVSATCESPALIHTSSTGTATGSRAEYFPQRSIYIDQHIDSRQLGGDPYSVKIRAALLAGVTALTFSVSACASTGPTDTPDHADGERADEPTTAEVLEEATPEPTPEPLEVSVTGPSTTTSNQVTLRDVSRRTAEGPGRRQAREGQGAHLDAQGHHQKTGDNRYEVVATKSGHDRDSTTAIVTRKLIPRPRRAGPFHGQARRPS